MGVVYGAIFGRIPAVDKTRRRFSSLLFRSVELSRAIVPRTIAFYYSNLLVPHWINKNHTVVSCLGGVSFLCSPVYAYAINLMTLVG